MRKGLSPLITVVILIVITIAISAVLAYWAQQYIFVKTRNASEADKSITNCLKIDFSISGKFSNGKPVLMVENSGNAVINGLAPIILESTHGDVITVNSSDISPPLNTSIMPGNVRIFTLSEELSSLLRGEEWAITARPKECPGIKRFGTLKG